jgi:hypothetical protein
MPDMPAASPPSAASLPPAATREINPQLKPQPVPAPAAEMGGVRGPDPTRYGDWERGGRCIDF